MTSASYLAPLALLLIVIGADLWVYLDAKGREERGAPVVFSSALVTIDTPATWAVGCLLLSIVVLPLYFTMRRQGG